MAFILHGCLMVDKEAGVIGNKEQVTLPKHAFHGTGGLFEDSQFNLFFVRTMQENSKIPSSPIKPVQATFQPRRRRIYDFNLIYLFYFYFILLALKGEGEMGEKGGEGK
ncbi:unnamed protein product [Bursaphelenchus xylophilus]|nr:unnamed protein product [Bursaphelenchus xylophilus]CAG9087797.1 unnamed protein product [Bursaphelenchus xylophilus]